MTQPSTAAIGFLAAMALFLSACSTLPSAHKTADKNTCPASNAQSQCPVCEVCEKTAGKTPPVSAKPLQAAQWTDLPGWQNDDLSAAWPVFLQSCRALSSRREWALWQGVCDAAKTLPSTDQHAVRQFFETRFAPFLLVGPDANPSGLITGYYEPLLRASRTRSQSFAQPLLGVPPDLLSIDLSSVVPELKNLRLRGRLQGNKIVPYFSRAEIVNTQNSADINDHVLFWVDDPIELFFLQIQGSGRLRLPDGSLVRVGYADQNGHPYRSIGRVLIERGALKAEQASMQGIQAWARANPHELEELLNSNPSYVFFRELPNGKNSDGPLGALGVPLVAERSIAVDPRTTPLGAPVFLDTTEPNSKNLLQRLVFAQDTGGAIRGVVRADFFWGFGAEAGRYAGRMKQSGKMWLLLPPSVAQSINAASAP